MKTFIAGLVVAFALVAALEARAQDAPKPILVNPAAMQTYPGPGAAPCDGCGANGVNGPGAGKKNGPIHRCIDKFERHGCGYGKTHHDFGCLGVRAHFVFIFGNCQQYFEEPCYKQPQHPWFQK